MDKEIGSLLRERRIELGLTMKQVGAACDVSESTISRWETGEIDNIKRGSIYLLSKVLFLPINTILGIQTDEQIISAEIINKRREIINSLEDLNVQELDDVDRFIKTFIKRK